MPDTVTVSADDIRLVTETFSIAANAFGGSLGHIPTFGAALEACCRMRQAADTGTLPEDPVTGGATLAIMLHEQLLEYERQEFSRGEAFELTKIHAAAVIQLGAMRTLASG